MNCEEEGFCLYIFIITRKLALFFSSWINAMVITLLACLLCRLRVFCVAEEIDTWFAYLDIFSASFRFWRIEVVGGTNTNQHHIEGELEWHNTVRLVAA